MRTKHVGTLTLSSATTFNLSFAVDDWGTREKLVIQISGGGANTYRSLVFGTMISDGVTGLTQISPENPEGPALFVDIPRTRRITVAVQVTEFTSSAPVDVWVLQ